MPHFIGAEPSIDQSGGDQHLLEASEALARSLGISRERQDGHALASHQRAEAAREARRFVGEIVPLKVSAEESRDQGLGEIDAEELENMAPILSEDGTLTAGNTSAINDGAALVVVVGEAVWNELDRPPALRLVASSAAGVGPGEGAAAPIIAVKKLYGRLNGFDVGSIGVVELSETSAAQAIAVADALGYDESRLNPDGGALVRGHPLGAAGAVLVVRLFTHLVRGDVAARPKFGIAALGTIGGMGLAALFEAV